MKKLRLPAALLPVIFLSVLNAGALEILSIGKAATEKRNISDFAFSGPIVVKNIAFEKNAVVMPVTEYKDKTYKDIKLLSKSLYAKIEACFMNKKCSTTDPVVQPKLTVSDVRPLKSPVRVANVTVVFDGDLSVTFGLIKRSSGESFAAYPDNFQVKDDALKGLIDKTVVEGFKKGPPADKQTTAPKK